MLEVVEQKDRIVILKKNFSDGVDRWKKKNTDKAILDIFKNIFDLLVQLPEIIATGADLGNVLSFETFAEVIQSIWPNDVDRFGQMTLLIGQTRQTGNACYRPKTPWVNL